MRNPFFKMIAFLLMLLCMAAVRLPIALADSQSQYEYTTANGQATITGYTGSGGAISIPDSLGGQPVTAITACAFSNSFGNSITSVVVPQGITSIGAVAFAGCASLSAVYFRGDAPSLGGNAFLDCAGNLKIYYPYDAANWTDPWHGYVAEPYDSSAAYTVGYNSNGAAAGIAPVDAASYPTGEAVTVMGNTGGMARGGDVFDGWNTSPDGKGLQFAAGSVFAITEDVTLYAQWKRILTPGTPSTWTHDGIAWTYTPLGTDYCEINGCSPIPAQMQIPAEILGRKVIGVADGAFDSPLGLMSLTLPDTINYIGKMAFRNCRDLMSVTLPDSITRIGVCSFYLCDNLVSIVFPSGVTDIGGSAFSCCSMLTEAVFEGDEPSIGADAFSNCSRYFLFFRPDAAQGWADTCQGFTVKPYHEVDTYTVTYDVNGGTGAVPEEVASLAMADVLVAPGQGGISNGYFSFAGWNTSPDGSGMAIDAETRFAVSGDMTLYAVWYMNYHEADYQKQTVIGGATWNYTPIGEFFCSVNNCNPAAGDITIPDFLDGRMVIGVAQCAFGYNTEITSVAIPPTVTTICKDAFFCCSNLSTVIFRGDAPTEVGYWAMKYCSDNLKILYPVGASGWSSDWNGFPTQSYEPVATYSVTYDANGAQTGSAPADGCSYLSLAEAKVMDNTGGMTKPDFFFAGWNTHKDGTGVDYPAGGTLIVTGNITLYARWNPVFCTVRFNRQDGSAITTQKVNYGATASEPAKPSRAGYVFVGWYREAACTSVWLFSDFKVTRDITLYARWLGVPTSPKANSASYNSIKVTWKAVPGATGYIVYRSTSLNGAYSPVATVTNTYYVNARLSTNKLYYFKVRAFTSHITTTRITGGYSAAVSARPVPSAPAGVKAVRVAAKSIKVSWAAVAGSTRYEVWRSTSARGTYKLAAAVGSVCGYTNTGLRANTVYYYKVRAYRLVGSTKVYSGFSAVVHARS